VSSSFFDVLGTRAAIGRVLVAADDKQHSNVAVVSDDWWQRRWQRDAGITGRAITIDNVAYEVVGVMPPGFRFYHQRGYGSGSDTTDVWLSDPFKYVAVDNDLLGVLSAIGRLRVGVTPSQAAAELGATSIALRRARGLPDDLAGVAVVRLRDSLTESSRRTLLISWAIAAFALLIAAINLAVLSLARTEARRSELDLRGALGAGRLRLVRQLLTESALLAAVAGALGAGLVAWTGPLLNALLPRAETLVRLGEAGATWHVIVFTIAATSLAVLVFGTTPAWMGSRWNGLGASQWNRISSSRRSARVRQSLVVLQLSLSLIVMAATALLVASAWREQHVPLGFPPDHLLTLNVRYPRATPYVSGVGVRSVALGVTVSEEQHPPGTMTLPHYALTPYGAALPRRIAERLATVPGVDAAAVASSMPMLRSTGEAFRVEGRRVAADEAVWGVTCRITPDYFKTLGLRLVRGRVLNEADTRGSPRVMVVNETLARGFLGGVDRALGRRITVNPGAVGQWVAYDIVGVISDARFWTRIDVGPQMYVSFDQSVDDAYGAIAMIWRLDFWVAVRTHDNTAATVAAVTRAVDEVDGGAPVERVEFMDNIVARGAENARGLLWLLVISAATAVFLSAIGVFGVTAFGVSRRVREFGIRVALGASPRTIATHVLWGGVRFAALGVMVGALEASRRSRSSA
jgi:putative ABC transport system permease protein